MLTAISYLVRTSLFGFAVYLIYFIYPVLPYIERSPSDYIEENDSILYYLQGSEWALIAIFVFIVSFIGWHSLFWSLIKGKNFLFRIFNRSIITRLFDYVWYFTGMLSLILLLIGMNAKEVSQHIATKEEKLNNEVKYVFEKLKSYEKPCLTLSLARTEKMKNSIIEDIGLFREMCSAMNEDLNFLVEEKCVESPKSWEFSDNFSSPYNKSEHVDKYLADSLNYMFYLCGGMTRTLELRKEIKLLESASSRYFDNEEKRSLTWFLLFPVLISLRLVKTSAELSDAIRSLKKKKHE